MPALQCSMPLLTATHFLKMVPSAARMAAASGRQSQLYTSVEQLLQRRGFRSSRPRNVEIVSQARKGLSELLSLTKKDDGEKAPPLRPGKVSPMLEVPAHIMRPPYADSGSMPDWDTTPQIHDAAGIEKMRAAGKLAAEVLDMAGKMAQPGVTTDEIDRAVHKMAVEAGAYPSPLNYGRFPKSVCTSVNECICHGIPDSRQLRDGDIVNIDVTVFLNGYHGDTSRMFYVGDVAPAARQLCEATKEALNAAIKVCGPGVPIKEIGRTINAIGDKHKYGVVKVFVGHGVGTVFHSWPHVAHTRNNEPGVMQKGMTFTIEPMFTMGRPAERYWADGWTAVTADGSLSAQWEHTLLITDSGVDILTAYE